MGLIVDTSVLIDLERQTLNFQKLEATEPNETLYLAAISASELLVGIHLAKNEELRVKRTAYVESILKQMPILPFSYPEAKIYAELHAYFLRTKSSHSPGSHDLLIAATAITHDFSVLTLNKKDFIKIPGVRIKSF